MISSFLSSEHGEREYHVQQNQQAHDNFQHRDLIS